MKDLFAGAFAGKRVLVTGHTGFKGSWLATWLSAMGAQVAGYSLAPPTKPNHFELLPNTVDSAIGDITDPESLARVLERIRPELVFHLAAQPLVRDSYADPRATYQANVIGTLNVCHACRATPSVRGLVVITTDKVYLNREWHWDYREVDELGGYDPYSSSKACAEILASSYRQSFCTPDRGLLLATARAGNVIGGGDWARDRLVPDIMRAASNAQVVTIRSPQSVRPWQHVLDCLSGYLCLGQQLLAGRSEHACAYNFGPDRDDERTVEQVTARITAQWSAVKFEVRRDPNAPHEAGMLRLNSSKARALLGWRGVWNCDTAVERTVAWYRAFYESGAVRTGDDIAAYVSDATSQEMPWTRVS